MQNVNLKLDPTRSSVGGCQTMNLVSRLTDVVHQWSARRCRGGAQAGQNRLETEPWPLSDVSESHLGKWPLAPL